MTYSKTLICIIVGMLFSCNTNNSDVRNDSIGEGVDSIVGDNSNELPECINSVIGHDERDTIWGNFTGRGIDTLWVVSEIDTTLDDPIDMCKYYAVSNNKMIPKIELYGCCDYSPKLVYEGDLDQNGTDEWGYLHTWMMSQWRYYRVFTLSNNTWYYLVEDDKLSTPEWFRCSGKEIVEPADKPGYVIIHYGTFGPDLDFGDTVIKAKYVKIKN